MAVKAELDLREILLTTGLVQPVRVEGKGSRLSALCREVPGQTAAWLKVVEQILREAAGSPMVFHLCRQYVWKDGNLVFGWHVGLEAPSAAALSGQLLWLREQLQNIEPELPQELAPEPQAAAVLPPPPPPGAVVLAQGPSEPDDYDDDPPPPQSADLAARRAEFRKHTNATPRAPMPTPEGVTEPPPEEKIPPKLKVVHKSMAMDQHNRARPVIIEEFPLPHVFTADMNRPNEKGRGVSKVRE